MICIHYEIYSNKTGELILENFGWFSSREAAWKELIAAWNKIGIVVLKK